MSSANKAFSGMTWSIVVNLTNAIYGFIAAPLLIRYFGRSEYGIIALAQSVNAYMALMDMGLSSTNVRFFSNWLVKGNNGKVRKLMQTCTAFYGCVGVVNAAVLILVSFFSSQIFNVTTQQDVVLKQMLWILSGVAVINWFTSCYGQLISATENVAWVQKRTLFTKLLMIVVVVATLLLNFSILQYFIGVILSGLVVLPATIRKVRKETPFISFLPKFDKEVFKEILPYSLQMFSFGIFQFSYNHLKAIIVGAQGSIASVTDYGVMTSLAGLVAMIGGVFIQALLPASSRIVANGDKTAFDRVAYKGTHYITIILCFCAFGLMTINQDLMMVYVGEDFMHLIPWLNIWLVLTVTGNVSCISSLILGGSNIKPLTYSSAVASISAIVTCWYAVPYFEAGGVVIGMIVYNGIQQIFYYTYYWRKTLGLDTWRIFIRTDVPFLLIGASITAILTYCPHFDNHWVNIIVFGIFFVLLYSFAVYMVLDKEDTKYVIRLIKRR